MDHWFYCLRSSWHSVKHSKETWQEVPVSMDTDWRWLRDWRGWELLKRSWVGRGPGSSAPLIDVLLHVGGNVLDGQHGLLARRFDLRLGQQEAITTSVTQLKGVGIPHSQVVGPVIRTTSSRVWGQIKERELFRVGVVFSWQLCSFFFLSQIHKSLHAKTKGAKLNCRTAWTHRLLLRQVHLCIEYRTGYAEQRLHPGQPSAGMQNRKIELRWRGLLSNSKSNALLGKLIVKTRLSGTESQTNSTSSTQYHQSQF